MGNSPRRPDTSPMDQPPLGSDRTVISSPVRKLNSSDDPEKSNMARITLRDAEGTDEPSADMELDDELDDDDLNGWPRC